MGIKWKHTHIYTHIFKHLDMQSKRWLKKNVLLVAHLHEYFLHKDKVVQQVCSQAVFEGTNLRHSTQIVPFTQHHPVCGCRGKGKYMK